MALHVFAQPTAHNPLQVDVQPREHSFTQLDLHNASQFPSQELLKRGAVVTCALEGKMTNRGSNPIDSLKKLLRLKTSSFISTHF